MKKLFLTSFKFKTGDAEFNEHRLVLVTERDRLEVVAKYGLNYPEQVPDETAIATNKFQVWFKLTYPESELLTVITHDTIADVPLCLDGVLPPQWPKS